MDRNEIVKDIFGPDVFVESIGSKKKLFSSSVSNALDLVNKHIKSSLVKHTQEKNVEDYGNGRIGPNLVRFDMSTCVGLFSISADKLIVSARSPFSTVRANVAVYKGKWMYEVQLDSNATMQIGWSTVKCKFNPEFGVGDTINSYAYDGNRVRKWNVATQQYGEPWLAGDIIGCAIDMDDGTVDFYRNGRHLGRAFENIAMGPGFAYFPTVSIIRAGGLRANFGSTPMHFPVEGYEPLQAAPKQEIVQAAILFEWFLKIVKRLNLEQNTNEQTMLFDKDMSVQAFLMCLSNSILKHIGPLLTVPYIIEHSFIPLMQELSELETDSRPVLLTCLDLLWTLLEEHEMKACLESMLLFLFNSTFRHATCLLEYGDQCKNILFLINICKHTQTRQYLLQHVLFEHVMFPNFINIKPLDKGGLADIVTDAWWETDPIDPEIEVNKESYFNACKLIKSTIFELEKLQIQLLVILLDNSDGNERRPTSRTIFLRKLKRFISIANIDTTANTLCFVDRLISVFQILWDAEVQTYPVYIPCSVFYDGSIDYSRTERLGGVVSHLNKTHREELVRRLGPDHEVVTMEQTQDLSSSYTGLRFVRVINMNLLGQGSSMNFDTTPLRLNSLDATASLLELLDSIILFYHLAAKGPLAKGTYLRNSMSEYIFAFQDIKKRLEEVKTKDDPESPTIQQVLSKTLDIFHTKLMEQARHMAWVRVAVYSEEKQLHLSWLLKVVALTLKNASLDDMFSFVADFYLEALADLCVGLRNRMHPTADIENIPDYRETFTSIAEFLCEHFMDPRIVNINSKSTLLLTLAGFVYNPLTLKCLENVPEESRVKLVTNLFKSYENRAWAESNWILIRFWEGNGFAFGKRVGLKLFQQESISQPKKPCPSVIYQGHVRDVLLKNPQDTTTFLNTMLNLLNWTFSEFIEMMQEIHNGSSRPERVFIESSQLKICASCFDLTVSLLRALEMVITVVPNIFNNLSQTFNENLLFRLCQLLCQVLNRMSSPTSCFQHVVLLKIPDLESVDHFPILTAITGILLALLKDDMANFNPNSVTEIPKVTQTLLMEPDFQINTLHFVLGESEVKNKQGKTVKSFSLLDYPDDVTEEEIKKVTEIIEYLDKCRAVLPNLKALSDNSDICIICYAQPISVTFKPCNHQACRICIDRHLLNSRSCFFCKAIIEKVEDLSGNTLHDFSNDTAVPK